MTAGGWIFLVLSWGVVSAFTAFCFYKLIRSVGLK